MTTVESGVAFPDQAPDAEVSVSATFIESGTQLQQLFVGLEPVLIIQPEYDADQNEITFVMTAVDIDAAGLVDLFDVLKHAAEEMVSQQDEMRASQNVDTSLDDQHST